MNSQNELYGGIEAGGTKFVCVVGKGPDQLEEVTRFPTTNPEETLGKTLAFFEPWKERLTAIGIGSFGPLNVNPDSSNYGCIEKTPKAGWSGTDILSKVKELGSPATIDMDVAASAYGEFTWGAGQGLKNFMYITVGTGIGASAMVNGKPLTGLAAPEMGHVLIPENPNESFQGICPFHQGCLEGFASGPAIEAHWGVNAKELDPDHPAWDLESDYLSSALVNYIVTLTPMRIVMGGGVMKQEQLFPLIRKKVQKKLNGYVDRPEILSDIDRYIVPPGLGDEAGILGCLVMARRLNPPS